MPEGKTTIEVNTEVRDDLRRYKAQNGDTYNEAIVRLLVSVGWLDERTSDNGEE